jgi:hypothetical protein
MTTATPDPEIPMPAEAPTLSMEPPAAPGAAAAGGWRPNAFVAWRAVGYEESAE